jgi:GxxExxY protein
MSLLYGVSPPRLRFNSLSLTKGTHLGEYAADLVVGEKVIVELKCVDRFANEHLAQCINYLKASRLSVALLFNFQKPKVEWERVLLDR